MSVGKWWRPVEEFEEIFEQLPTKWAKSWDLAADVSEDSTAVIIEMQVPGIVPDEINVEVADNYVVVSGSRQEEEVEEDKHFHQKEITRGVFERTIPLPAKVIADETLAEFKNGLLKIILPKEQSKKPHKIEVKKK